jgi:serpin B
MQHLLLLAAVATFACSEKRKDTPPPAPPPTPAPTPAADAQSPAPAEPHQVSNEMPPPAEIQLLARASNNFGLELWQQIPPGNAAISPLSISTALAMVWAGAKGNTAAQMAHVLHFEGDNDHVVSQWARVSYALQHSPRPFTLKMANRIYGDAAVQFDTIYFDITRKAFSAPLEIVDFAHDAETVRGKINTWVADQTEQRIKDLLPKGSVDSGTRLVIANAIYFLADWAAPFPREQTFDEPFKVGASKTIRVPTMHQQGTYKYARAEGMQLLLMPYQGNSADMYIILPDQPFGLMDVEKKLQKTLKTVQSKLADTTVLVSLPRFVIDPPAPLRLRETLSNMGMPAVFISIMADLSGMAKVDDKNHLWVSDVLHKTYVKVDEKGTEAAAATAVVAKGTGAPPQATPFKVDHPFLFMIVDRSSGLMLFFGRVVEPKPPA